MSLTAVPFLALSRGLSFRAAIKLEWRFWSEMNLNVDRLFDRCFTVLMALVFGVIILLIFNTLWLH